MRTNYARIRDSCHEKGELCVFQFVLDDPLDTRYPLHMVCMYVATLFCPKDILGKGGKHLKPNYKTTFKSQTSHILL